MSKSYGVVRESLVAPAVRGLDLSEAEGQQGPPKQPTEADRVKKTQEREKLDTAKRQSQELFSAKTRDLEKKSREQAQKLNAPKND